MAQNKQVPTHNPRLEFIKENWQGNPLHADRKSYVNLDGASERGLRDVLKWKLGKKPLKILKRGQSSPLELVNDGVFLNKEVNGFTWLGHTTFLFDITGIRLITDPILYNISLLKRFTELPCHPESLVNIDYILLSHNHRDHIDEKSIKFLCKQNPNAIILTGLQTGTLLRKWKVKNEIIEAGWYQSYGLGEKLDIHYLPAKHWTRRYLTDNNLTLWGSFLIKARAIDKNIYFGADSGYGVHFKEIGMHYPLIDFALLGIGAFEPYWFMHPSHTGPNDAIRAFLDLNAQCLMPMHYGTFDLSDEPIFYPEKELRRIVQESALNFVKFNKIGAKNTFF
jgi:L-ascorbate metabolism protein UlaG (beta-lactamase superfamily)